MPRVFQGPFLGKYGTQAGGAIGFYWVPDPAVFSEKILHVKDELEDRSVPLAISRGIIARDVGENFAGEHDPQGQPWAPWSSAYHTSDVSDIFGSHKAGDRKIYSDPATGKDYKQKGGYAENLPKGHSGKILDWRGILRECATDEASYVVVAGRAVTNDALFFNTNALPPYWVYHEQPTSPNSGNIPQRSFLGLSGDAELEVQEVFGDWFINILSEAAVIEPFTSSAGRTFARKRFPKGSPGGVGGRFMPAGS